MIWEHNQNLALGGRGDVYPAFAVNWKVVLWLTISDFTGLYSHIYDKYATSVYFVYCILFKDNIYNAVPNKLYFF